MNQTNIVQLDTNGILKHVQTQNGHTEGVFCTATPQRPATSWIQTIRFLQKSNRLKIPGSNPACTGIFSGSSHTSDFKIGTPVATLPGAWRYRVSNGTGQPGVSIL